jgi:hypothetical protein
MVRFINCVRKKDDVSMNEFRERWSSPEFAALTDRMVALTGAKDFRKNLTLQVEANVWVMEERGSGLPYDGVMEYWWENAVALVAVLNTPEGQALIDEMKSFQSGFVDPAGSTAFFTEAQ